MKKQQRKRVKISNQWESCNEKQLKQPTNEYVKENELKHATNDKIAMKKG